MLDPADLLRAGRAGSALHRFSSGEGAPRDLGVGLQGGAFPTINEDTYRRVSTRDALAGRIAGDAGPNRTRVSTYPGTALSPGRIRELLEEADRGIVYRYADLYHQLLRRDGHLFAADRERRAAVAGKEFRLAAIDETDLARSLRDLGEAVVDGIDNFDRANYSLLSASGLGYSAAEIIYAPRRLRFRGPTGDTVSVDGMWPVSLEWVHGKHFWFEYTHDAPLLDLGPDGKIPLPPHKFLLHLANGDGIIATRGWLQPAVWLHYLKHNGLRDWGVFVHLFGIPNIWATIKRALWNDPEYRSVLERAMQDFGQGTPSVVFDDMRVEISPAQAGSGSSGIHDKLVGFCNAELSKVVKGETLTSEQGTSGSYALSETHEATFYGTVKMDAVGLGATHRHQLLASAFEVNLAAICGATGAAPDEILAGIPRCGYRIEQEVTPYQRAQILDIGVNRLGAKVAASEFYDAFAVSRPRPGEEVLPGAPIAVSSGGATAGSLDAAAGVTNPQPQPAGAGAKQ
jgi:phage gp29-like protein